MAQKKMEGVPLVGVYADLTHYAKRTNYGKEIQVFADGIRVTKMDDTKVLLPLADFTLLSTQLEHDYKRERALHPTDAEKEVDNMKIDKDPPD